MAVTEKPLTVDKLKKILDMLKYYDISDSLCKEHITDTVHTEFCKKRLQENEIHRQNVLKLFNYADSDFDMELLRRRYIENKDYYDIAFEMGYCDRHIFKCFQHALDYQRMLKIYLILSIESVLNSYYFFEKHIKIW